MADSYFGFDADFQEINVLGRQGLNEELLTDDIEEEYDALNDETFGHAANDDWEEAHEKLSEMVKGKGFKISDFNDSFFEAEESQNEIVSKCISHMGLGDDDLDDPAIMTVSRKKDITNLESIGQLSSTSPVLESEKYGSPKTRSIWSTSSKESGIASLIQSISHNANSSHML